MNIIKHKNTILLIFCIFLCIDIQAQNINTASAKVIKTEHNELLTNDTTTDGYFYYKYPDKMCIRLNNMKDMLLMDGSTYTLMENGEKSIAKGKIMELFNVLQNVLQNIICNNPMADVTLCEAAQIDKNGNTITITPKINTKNRRRIIFTSFVIEFDNNSLKSIRMNKTGENYTQYDMYDYTTNCDINDNVFIP